MTIVRRILGVLMIIVGIAGLIIALAFTIYGRQLVDTVAVGLNTTTDLLLQTVGTTTDSLVNVKSTIDEAATTLDTVTETAANLSTTLVDTEPLLTTVNSLATETVPDSLEAIQTAIPNLADVAGSIDSTLMRLSELQVERSVFGVPISFDLGINYNPEEPFDTAVLQIGDSLVEVPEQLRSLDESLTAAVSNVSSIADNVQQLSTDLVGVTTSLVQFGPLLDEYIVILEDTARSLEETRAAFQANLNLIRWAVMGLGLWFALYQIVPLYVGWRMLTEDEDEDEDEIEAVVATPSATIVVGSDAETVVAVSDSDAMAEARSDPDAQDENVEKKQGSSS